MPSRAPGRGPWWGPVALYVVAGLAWIFGSDLLLSAVMGASRGAELAKGSLFVLITGGVLAALLARHDHQLQRREQQLSDRQQLLERRTHEVALLDRMAGDLIYRAVVDPEPRFVFVSAAAAEMVGYSPQDHYDDPALGAKLVHPDDQHLLTDPTALAGTVRLRWRHRDGHTIWAEQRNDLEVVDGRLVAINGVARDVTADELIRQGQELLAALDAAVMADQHIDDHLQEVTSSLRGIVEATSVHLVVDSAAGPRIAQQATSNGTARGQPCVREHGTVTLRVQLSTHSPRMAHVELLLGLVLPRLAAAVEAHGHRQHLRRLERALEATGSAVLLADPHGTIEWVNPAFEQITGYRRDEAVGLTPRLLKSGVQPTDFYEQLWAGITAGEHFSGHLVNRRRDGSFYRAAVTIDPVLDTRGQVAGFVGVQRDTTEEDEVRTRLHARETAAVERERDLERDRALLVQLLSHELRTPLAVVVGAAETLQRDALPSELRARVLASMWRGVDELVGRLDTLIGATDDLRTVAEPFAVRAVVQDVTAALRDDATRARLEVRGDAEWFGDRVLVAAVLRSLVVNALKYSPAGSMVSVDVEVAADGGIEVAVHDEGPGIPDEFVATLGRPFHQLDLGTTRVHGGLGMGLHVAWRAVDRLGATLRFDTGDVGGTTAVLALPPVEVPGA